MTGDDQEAYWRRTYADLHRGGPPWLDYASAAEQTFTFGACLLVSGPVAGMTCLDAGCGRGDFARLLRALGARSVVGMDFIETTIETLRRTDPQIRWQAGSITDPEALKEAGTFDRVFAIEVLECIAPGALASLWSVVGRGGRLIGVIPNADNPFVLDAIAKRRGLYAPPGPASLASMLSELLDVADWGLIGFQWRTDRGSLLYDLAPPTRIPDWTSPPKRLLFFARKAD